MATGNLSLARIAEMSFENFKALRDYRLIIEHMNILVGPNNAGKSTIIGALRALDGALRTARSRAPQRIYYDGTSDIGYRIPGSSLPIALENVHTNYNSQASSITFKLDNGNRLRLIFPAEGGCLLVPIVEGQAVGNAAGFKRHFPISLTIVPVLGPIENNEIRRERATVVDGLATHRASRHFRSYWHFFPDGFDEFSNLVKSTWHGMELERPEFDVSSGELTMFCREERMTRELYWVGFGFQIWCQLLTHISRSSGCSLLAVDEPETYLHPDVQRQLVAIVRDIGADVVLATHSSEILAESDPSEIIIIDKRRRSGERLRDVVGVQRALDAIGSVQNVTLTALARSRRVLFVEKEHDFRLLRRFARRLGMQELATGSGIVALPSGGFSFWRHVTAVASRISEALGASLSIAAVYGREHCCSEQIEEVIGSLSEQLSLAYVYKRNEIENYLLVPDAIERALNLICAQRAARSGFSSPDGNLLAGILLEITEPMRESVLSQIVARRRDYLQLTGREVLDVNKETTEWFDAGWDDLNTRLEIVSGKEVLRMIRSRLHNDFGVSLTEAQIVESMHPDEIPDDLQRLLGMLDSFREKVL